MFAQQRSQQGPPLPQYLTALLEYLVGVCEKPCGGELFEDRRAHVDGRAHRGDGRQRARSARIQPIRRPPQNDFDIEPIVSIRSRRGVISAAIGAGTGSSSHMSMIVSSMIVRVRVSAMMAPGVGDPLGKVNPVGF